LILPLVFFADVVPASAPASDDTSRVTLSAGAQVTATSSTYDASGASGASGARANGNADITVYPATPLVDDASPLSLQAFLQRTTALSLNAGGQYLFSNYTPTANGGTYKQDYVPASASARVFVTDSVAILGNAGVDYLHDDRAPAVGLGSTRDEWEPWGQVGIDARRGDAGLSLQWQVVGVSQSVSGQPAVWRNPFWGRFSLAGRLVIDRRWDLTASATVIPDGAEGRVALAYYPTKELGLSLFVQGDHGQIYWDSSTDYDSVMGGPAISYWFTHRTSLSVAYSPTWVHSSPSNITWDQPVSASFTVRVP